MLQEIFSDSIWLQEDASGKHFWAIFEDGVRAALFADPLDVAAFPIEESGADLRKVGESGSGGPLLNWKSMKRKDIRLR